MGRLPKRTAVLEPGGLYFLDGRKNDLELFLQVVSRQASRNYKYVKFLNCKKFNVFLLGEEDYFGISYVHVLAVDKTGAEDAGYTGFIKKDELLNAITGKSKLKYR